MQIYLPAEDSYFLAEQVSIYLRSLEKEKTKLKALDLGTGSGFQAQNLINQGIKKEAQCRYLSAQLSAS